MTTQVYMMAKAPVPGDVKTRLGREIGMEQSAAFHEAFIADLCETIARTSMNTTISYAGDADHAGFDIARTMGFQFEAQPDGGLGERLSAVARSGFELGSDVVIIGSDSPTILPEVLFNAGKALSKHDVVLGPSFDGGYYLVGLSREKFHEETGDLLTVFDGITWSSGSVLKETLEVSKAQQQRCHLLDFWYDVDTKVDLEFMAGHLAGYLNEIDPQVGRHTLELFERFESTGR